jgi:hypothetical protein
MPTEFHLDYIQQYLVHIFAGAWYPELRRLWSYSGKYPNYFNKAKKVRYGKAQYGTY